MPIVTRSRALEAARRRRNAQHLYAHHVPAPLHDVVLAVVAEIYRITPAQLTSACKEAYLVDARRIACQLLYERDCGETAIGRALCREHATVIHALRHLERHMSGADWDVLQEARYLVRRRLAKKGGGA